MKPARPGDKAKKLRADLANQIQALVDVYNNQRQALEDGISPTSMPLSTAELGELKSPGLLSLDFGTAMLLGRGKVGPDRIQKVAVYHTLLSAASLAGNLKLVNLMLHSKCGCSSDETSRSGVSPLLAACFAGHAQVVDKLLLFEFEEGDKVRGRKGGEERVVELVNVSLVGGACGRTCVEACALGGKAASENIIPILLKRGLRVNGIDIHLRSPIRIALQYSAFRAASLLLQHGAILSDDDIDALPKDESGCLTEDLADITEILMYAKFAKQQRQSKKSLLR
jgi:ankyrin repeat protein